MFKVKFNQIAALEIQAPRPIDQYIVPIVIHKALAIYPPVGKRYSSKFRLNNTTGGKFLAQLAPIW